MKEKVYLWLSLINVILFAVILYFVSIHSLWDYILVKIPSIVFWILFVLSIFWNFFDWWTKNKNNFVLNILVGAVTIFLFNYQPTLSSIVLLIFFSLPLFLKYDDLDDESESSKNKFNTYFLVSWITMLIQLFLLHVDGFRLSFILYYLILIISFLFLVPWKITWMKFKRKFWIYLIHLLSFLFCLSFFWGFLYPFQWTEIGWKITTSVFILLIVLFPFVLTVFNLVYLNILDKDFLWEELDNEELAY